MKEIRITLSPKDEIGLLDRYGRRNNTETLVKKAIAEVLKQQARNVPIFVGKEEHEARIRAAELKPASKVDALSTDTSLVERESLESTSGEDFNA